MSGQVGRYVEHSSISNTLNDFLEQVSNVSKTAKKVDKKVSIVYNLSDKKGKTNMEDYEKLMTWFFDYKMKLLEIEDEFQQLINYLNQEKLPNNPNIDQNLIKYEKKRKQTKDNMKLLINLSIYSLSLT